MGKFIKIHDTDTVAVALDPIAKGTVLEAFGITAATDIPTGHKIAIKNHAQGEPVIKYGASIGHAKAPIAAGSHVHTDNLGTALTGPLEYAYAGIPEDCAQKTEAPTIQAFLRKNGEIGIRNDLWIIPLVGCINGIAHNMAREFEASGALPEGARVIVLSHPYGCSQLGDDLANTRGILQNLAVHPNAGGVLILGLGCENNTMQYFKEGLELPDPDRVRFIVTQETEDEFDAAMAAMHELAKVMQGDKRQPVGADKLVVGLKCGGSDGFSGITANPLLGAFSDWICGVGGTSVLTEVPEMFGAEHLLMARSENEEVFKRTVSLINDFKQYYIDNKQPIYENPSPGNKAGGISTLEEKSLGCTQKAGLSVVRDVLRYTDRVKKPGLNLLEGPGNDGVATTALSAAGCHLVMFTTGRGTPLGGVVPTVKVATNSDLATRKKHWIDFDAGPIADGKTSVEELNTRFVETILAIAEGKPTRNEENAIHEITIFKTGVTL